MHDFSFLSPLFMGALCLKKPELFRHKRWTEESFIVIRGMGVVLIGIAVAFAILG